MVKLRYTNDRGTQIVLSLLKSHGIKRVIASPGTTNIALVASMQYDPWFEVYSSVDERSAAYMACGMSHESGEPVVITCTGATASRNYFSALTEAYYRKLPIIAITGSHGDEKIGHLFSQAIDRSQAPKDTIKSSININNITNDEDERKVIDDVNRVLLDAISDGGGPVHINLRVGISSGFTTENLPSIRTIHRYLPTDKLPQIPAGRTLIFIGAHKVFSKEATKSIQEFCERYNSAIICDHTSGYYGKYKIQNALSACQQYGDQSLINVNLLIHLGEVSADTYDTSHICSKETWRISDDGVIRDLFGNLTAVFWGEESLFFKRFIDNKSGSNNVAYYCELKSAYDELYNSIPELPFSNVWIAQQIHDKIPKGAVLQFGIYNSLRSWNFFEIDSSICTSCNVGGFGIDGAISTLIGSALVNPDKLHFLILGDLAFFYDINSLGNRHRLPNLRILLINNGCGTEFKNYDHPASQWGGDADVYMAAAGHFGKKSRNLVKHYTEDLGYKYITASTKNEFLNSFTHFLNPNIMESPIVFEVFTDSDSESDAIHIIRNIDTSNRTIVAKSKSAIKGVLAKLNKHN